jgi:hypothetical protein
MPGCGLRFRGSDDIADENFFHIQVQEESEMKSFFVMTLPPAAVLLAVGLLAFGLAACGKPERTVVSRAPADEVRRELEKFTPVTLSADLKSLSTGDAEAVRLLVKAGRIMDELFLRQVDERNPAIRRELERSSDPADRPYLDFFNVMFGSWNRINGDKPFLNDKPKPLGAAFYPEDMTADEFQAAVNARPGQKEAFEGNFTVIRRRPDGLAAVPYSEYYKEPLDRAAGLLRRAGRSTTDPGLARFLESRAAAFGSNDYFKSDMDWMDLAGDVECVIGPYEVYEDKLFGYKAAFEAFVCVVDSVESARWKAVEERLPELEKTLPMPSPAPDAAARGLASPIKVVDLAFSGGDTKAGVQTAAFNLPNDERVQAAKGSKKVILRNVMAAKFEKCWMPIARRVLDPACFERVAFDAYFTHTLMHEVAHALGPGILKKDGRETTVNRELKDLYPTIEECKADVLGLFTAHWLVDRGVFPETLRRTLDATNLGGMFRAIRFGIDEAHGGGVAIQLNYYLDAGAFRVDADGRFGLDGRRMESATRALAAELLAIEAAGDYAAAGRFVAKYRTLQPEVARALKTVADVPVDIRPVYAVESEIR